MKLDFPLLCFSLWVCFKCTWINDLLTTFTKDVKLQLHVRGMAEETLDKKKENAPQKSGHAGISVDGER